MRSSTSASSALRFASRAALFAGLLGGCAWALVHWGPPAAPSEYMSSTVLKNTRLRSIGSPKAVLIGGSNLTYGVESDCLGDALCMPVANMGLTAVLGFRFVAEEVLACAGKGDLLIVCLEHGTYRQPDPQPDALATVVDYRPEALELIPWRRRPRLIGSLVVMHAQTLRDHVWSRIMHGETPQYTKRRFLPNGDLVSHLDVPMRAIAIPERYIYDTLVIDPHFWRLAAEFEQRAEQRGARVVFAFAPMARAIYNTRVQEALYDSLSAHGLTLAGFPDRYAYDDSLFYDSWYHLRRQGRAMRTEQLIRDLCETLPESCCAAQGRME